MKLSLEILDLVIDRYSEEEEYHDGNTILHGIARGLFKSIKGCCEDKWLLFLRMIVDRFPVEILSTQDSTGRTPYNWLIFYSSLYDDKKLMKEVLEILKPR